MCGIGNVNIGISVDCCTPTCCLAGVGVVRQKITGDGIAFLQAGGTVLEKTLEEGEKIMVGSRSSGRAALGGEPEVGEGPTPQRSSPPLAQPPLNLRPLRCSAFSFFCALPGLRRLTRSRS